METRKDSGVSSENTMVRDSLLQKFFLDGLKDIYWAEKHIVKALPKMKKAAHSPQLEQALEDHLEVTNKQVERLEQVFQILDKKAETKKCEAMEGLLDEGEDIISETKEGTATRDVGIIMAAQKVEHYEIATYGGLAQLARTLGYSNIAELLNTTLYEENEADRALSEIAENDINYQASSETTETARRS